MKFIDEFREPELIKKILDKIHKEIKSNITIMEVCGGQTHSIIKYGILDLLPDKIHIIHGPGCPVCVTPLNAIDKAIYFARNNDYILTTFGDMLRVPGSRDDLIKTKANGGNVKIVISPLDSIKIAKDNPDKKVIFFAVGFETTAPLTAFVLTEAKRLKLKNFFVLCSHFLIPPAIELILSSTECKINSLLAAGHVTTIMGTDEYRFLSKKYNIPIIVTGFEPLDILLSIQIAIDKFQNKEYEVINAYKRVVNDSGNTKAKQLVNEVFETEDKIWRGLGLIPLSGLKIKSEFSDFDAENLLNIKIDTKEPEICISGAILSGAKKPFECEAFGTSCTPLTPIGAPMVSSEGVCNAYYKYGRKVYDK